MCTVAALGFLTSLFTKSYSMNRDFSSSQGLRVGSQASDVESTSSVAEFKRLMGKTGAGVNE
jgi:hypothetical protein